MIMEAASTRFSPSIYDTLNEFVDMVGVLIMWGDERGEQKEFLDLELRTCS